MYYYQLKKKKKVNFILVTQNIICSFIIIYEVPFELEFDSFITEIICLFKFPDIFSSSWFLKKSLIVSIFLSFFSMKQILIIKLTILINNYILIIILIYINNFYYNFYKHTITKLFIFG